MKYSELFFSIQGEGKLIGVPSIFIRTSYCNLRCRWCFGIKKGRHIPKVISWDKNKYLYEVKVGDELLTLDNKHKLVETEVTKVHKRTVDEWYEIKINGTLYFVTPEHPVFTKRGLVKARDLKKGDVLFHINDSDRSSYKMSHYNPMFNKKSVAKKVKNTDWEKVGQKISKTRKRLFKEGKLKPPPNLQNGYTVESIKHINRNDKKYKYDYQKPKKLIVYNLSCSPYNSYLIDYFWVHNCDSSYTSWHPEDKEISVAEILNEIEGFNCKHVVITGGEPFVQKDELIILCEELFKRGYHITIETNATIYAPVKAHLISMSPKLKNSSPSLDSKQFRMHNKNRIKPEIIRQFLAEYDCQVKFVVDSQDDLEEIIELEETVPIPNEKICLMPQARKQKEIQSKQQWIVEICKERNYRYSPRLQIRIWGEKRGV